MAWPPFYGRSPNTRKLAMAALTHFVACTYLILKSNKKQLFRFLRIYCHQVMRQHISKQGQLDTFALAFARENIPAIKSTFLISYYSLSLQLSMENLTIMWEVIEFIILILFIVETVFEEAPSSTLRAYRKHDDLLTQTVSHPDPLHCCGNHV